MSGRTRCEFQCGRVGARRDDEVIDQDRGDGAGEDEGGPMRRRGRGAGKVGQGGQGGCGSEARDGESRGRHLELVHSPAVARYTYPIASNEALHLGVPGAEGR